MKKNKLIRFLIIGILIILIILILLLKVINNTQKDELKNVVNDEEPILESEENIDEIEQLNTFCMVEKIINKNVELGNIFYANKIYFQEDSSIDGYKLYIFGELFNTNNKIAKNIFWAIDFNELEGKYKISQMKEDIELSEFEQIAKNGTQQYLTTQNFTGEFLQEDITENNIVKRYFEYYKLLILTKPEKAYLLINDEYKEIRFGNYDNFYKYINDNIEIFNNMEFNKFQINYYEDYTQYVSLSNSGNYYIFNVNKVMDFSVLLDQYIVDLPQFTTKYESSDVRIKVALNINKFIMGINDKNYNYINILLADSFKNANSITNNTEVEKFITNNFYSQNDIEFLTFEEQGSYYIYTASLKDKNSNQKKTIKIVVQLEEGTKFKMSFSF